MGKTWENMGTQHVRVTAGSAASILRHNCCAAQTLCPCFFCFFPPNARQAVSRAARSQGGSPIAHFQRLPNYIRMIVAVSGRFLPMRSEKI